MFKVETTVRLVLISLLLGGAWANAEDTAASTTQPNQDYLGAKMYEVRCGTEAARNSNKDFCASMDAKYLGGGSCSTAESDYTKALTELNKSCPDVASKQGWPSCTKAYYDCAKAVSKPRGKGGEGSKVPYDLEQARKQLKSCPLSLGAKQKELEEKTEESRKSLRELKDKIESAQSKVDEATKEMEEKVEQLQTEMTEAQNEAEQKVHEETAKMEEQVKGIQTQIDGIQNQIRQAQFAIEKASLSKTTFENKFLSDQSVLEVECTKSAQQIVNAQAAMARSQTVAGENVGDMKTLMKRAGLTTRELWQRKIKEEYEYCMKSKLTTNALTQARRARRESIDGVDAEINRIRGEQGAMNQAIKKLDNGAGCSPFAGQNETDKCRVIRQSTTNVQMINRQAQTTIATKQQQMQKAQMSGAQKIAAAQKALFDLQQDIKEEQTRLDNYQAMLELAYEAGGSDEESAKRYTEGRGRYLDVVQAATNFVGCKEEQSCDSRCQDAQRFLTNIGQPGIYKEQSAVSPPATTTPAAAPTAPAGGTSSDATRGGG